MKENLKPYVYKQSKSVDPRPKLGVQDSSKDFESTILEGMRGNNWFYFKQT